MIRTPKVKVNRAIKTEDVTISVGLIRKDTRFVIKHRVPEKNSLVGSRG